MTSRIDEVEATVNSTVNYVSSVQATFILQIFLKLVIYVFDYGLEAKKQNMIFDLESFSVIRNMFVLIYHVKLEYTSIHKKYQRYYFRKINL